MKRENNFEVKIVPINNIENVKEIIENTINMSNNNHINSASFRFKPENNNVPNNDNSLLNKKIYTASAEAVIACNGHTSIRCGDVSDINMVINYRNQFINVKDLNPNRIITLGKFDNDNNNLLIDNRRYSITKYPLDKIDEINLLNRAFTYPVFNSNKKIICYVHTNNNIYELLQELFELLESMYDDFSSINCTNFNISKITKK